MNINDLLEALHNTEVKARTYSGVGKPSRGRLGGGQRVPTIGVGTRAAVADDKTDPHMVRKYNPMAVPEDGADGFGKFAEWVVANDIENRYLPRVYKITKNKNPDSEYVAYVFKVEKLIKLSSLSEDESIALLSSFIKPDEIYKEYIDFTGDKITDETIKRNYESILYYALKYVDSVFVGNIDDNSFITDDELIAAIRILKRYVAEQFNGNFRRAGADLHDGNFMARRTQHGLQLVISDPFW